VKADHLLDHPLMPWALAAGVLALCLLLVGCARGGEEDGLTEWEKYQVDVHLPPYELAKEMSAAADAAYHYWKNLADRTAGKKWPQGWADAYGDATRRSFVWWHIAQAADYSRSSGDRRWHLWQLIGLVGVSDYIRGWFPNPYPPGDWDMVLER
jgi:hypothetical protein